MIIKISVLLQSANSLNFLTKKRVRLVDKSVVYNKFKKPPKRSNPYSVSWKKKKRLSIQIAAGSL